MKGIEWAMHCGRMAAKVDGPRSNPFLPGGHSMPVHEDGEPPRYVLTVPGLREAWHAAYIANGGEPTGESPCDASSPS